MPGGEGAAVDKSEARRRATATRRLVIIVVEPKKSRDKKQCRKLLSLILRSPENAVSIRRIKDEFLTVALLVEERHLILRGQGNDNTAMVI